jgi:hypothetical protein
MGDYKVVDELINIIWIKTQLDYFLTYMWRKKKLKPIQNDYDMDFWK